MRTLKQAQAHQQHLYKVSIRAKLRVCLAHYADWFMSAKYVYTQQEMQELQAEQVHRQATSGSHYMG